MTTSSLQRFAPSAIVLLSAALIACSPDALTTARPGASPRHIVGPTPTVIVTNTNDDGPGSLRKATENANSGTVVGFDPSLANQTIGILSPMVLDRNITIDGSAAPNLVISGLDASQVFYVYDDYYSTFSNLTIAHGKLIGKGGCIFNNGTLTLDHVTVRDCKGSEGAGVYNNVTLTIRNSLFSNNQAFGVGGGIGSKLGSVLLIEDSDFYGNSSLQSAGGMEANGSTIVRRSLFRGHQAQYGAAIQISQGSFLLENSTITGNRSSSGGGSAIGSGAGNVTIVNSTIVNNESQASYGSLGTESGSFTLRNSIVSSSSGLSCGTLTVPTMLGRNLVDDASCGAASANLIIGAPGVGALGANGGPTATHAILVGSAALDGGSDCTVDTDQRGISRPQGTTCDIGAFEFNDFTTATLTIDPSGTVNSKSGIMYVSGTSVCSKPTTLMISVTATQVQKAGKVNTTIVATNTIPVACSAASAWAIALTPPTGAFNTTLSSVTVTTVASQKEVTPTSASNASVKISWSKK